MQYAANEKKGCASQRKAESSPAVPHERPARVCHAKLAFSMTHGTWSRLSHFRERITRRSWGSGPMPYAQ